MTGENSKALPAWPASFLDVNRGIDWVGVTAGLTMIAVPMLIDFLLVQGRMASGLAAGTVKT